MSHYICPSRLTRCPGCRSPPAASFCANPLVDAPAGDDDSLARRFPALARPNLWPAAELPELEGAFKALGALIVRVGLLLMRHADKYVAARAGMPPRLHDILQQSSCPKGGSAAYGRGWGGGGGGSGALGGTRVALQRSFAAADQDRLWPPPAPTSTTHRPPAALLCCAGERKPGGRRGGRKRRRAAAQLVRLAL